MTTQQGNVASPPPAATPPEAKIKRHGLFSWVWLIPIVAAGIVIYLAYTSYERRGPVVSLTFLSADGIIVGQTQIRHKAVSLGIVEDVHLAKNMKNVVVRVRMDKEAAPFLTDRARFWVIRPRISAGSLSGLETIVSGAYIEMDPGPADGKKTLEYTGLEKPPGRTSDDKGRAFSLEAERLGSLSPGAPIYFREVAVGEVLSYDVVGNSGQPVTLNVFIREPYDRYVKAASHFWNISGLTIGTGPEGMHVELESVQALLSGGIAFETPATAESAPVADDGAKFSLFPNKGASDAAFYRETISYVSYFETSVQGLSPGSPVQLFGVQVGNVKEVRLVYDEAKSRMVARVAFDVQPERVAAKQRDSQANIAEEVRRTFLYTGLRVVLESSSFLTGSKDLALKYTPGVHPSDMPKEGDAIVVANEGGGLDGITASLAEVSKKLEKIPFDRIGKNLDATVANLSHVSSTVDAQAGPALAQLPGIAASLNEAAGKANNALGPSGYGASSEFQRNLERMMNEMHDTARSVRVFADYLDRHPEALIRGRGKGDH